MDLAGAGITTTVTGNSRTAVPTKAGVRVVPGRCWLAKEHIMNSLQAMMCAHLLRPWSGSHLPVECFPNKFGTPPAFPIVGAFRVHQTVALCRRREAFR